ncbi:MAG: hemerythrin domain-containing protein [Betaproteobacteria bacterium]|nr:hemerythrin domain-containing protein [Betaproteobacteria bacterium]
MWLIDFLFGRKRKQAESQESQESGTDSGQAPGTRIAYSPDLIPQLKGDHQRLLEIFAMISEAFTNNDLAATSRLLEEFRGGILGHLLTENVRFYIYLEHALRQEDQESFNLIHHFRHEMDTIGKSVLAFFSKYQNIDKQPGLALSFGKDLENVGAILVERIRREEETLYPLYMPVY